MSKNFQQARFETLQKEELELFQAKNTDYANPKDALANLRACEKIGIPAWKGVVVRLTDKFSRLQNLAKNDGQHAVKDETIVDTLKDIANYANLCIILYEEKGSEVS